MIRSSHKLSVLVLATLSCVAQAQVMQASRALQMSASAERQIKLFPGLSLDEAGHSYSTRDIVMDDDGAGHVRMDRRINGLRAIGADLVVQAPPKLNGAGVAAINVGARLGVRGTPLAVPASVRSSSR